MTAEHVKKLESLDEAVVPSTRSRSSLSPTPDYLQDPELIEQELQSNLRIEHKAYHELVADGGQPSHCPSEANFDILDDPGKDEDIIRYWTPSSHVRTLIILAQWYRWQDFRAFQERWRKQLCTLGSFESHVREIRRYRVEKGLKGDICFPLDRKEQDRLDDWKEFQFWEHKKADRLLRNMERAADEKKASERRLQVAREACRTSRELACIKEHGIAFHEGRRRRMEIELEQQNVFLRWIEEQTAIVRESTSMRSCVEEQVCTCNLQSRKRKRLTEDTANCAVQQRRILAPVSDHNIHCLDELDISE